MVTEHVTNQSAELATSSTSPISSIALTANNVVTQLQKTAVIERHLEQTLTTMDKIKNELIVMLNTLVLAIKNAALRFNRAQFHSEININSRLLSVKSTIASIKTDDSIKDDVERQMYEVLLQNEFIRLHEVIERANANNAHFLELISQQSTFSRLASIRRQAIIEHKQIEKLKETSNPLGISIHFTKILQKLKTEAEAANLEVVPEFGGSDVLAFPTFRVKIQI